MKIAETKLRTKFGIFNEHLFYDGKEQAIVLSMGNVFKQENVLIRIHSHCISSHIFNSIECDCKEQMEFAQTIISKEGRGLIIWLDQEGKNNGHLAKMLSNKYKEKGYKQENAYEMCNYLADARQYHLAIKIINYFKISSIRLITNHERKSCLLKDGGIKISEIVNTPVFNEDIVPFNM